jgi:hypothetical protein
VVRIEQAQTPSGTAPQLASSSSVLLDSTSATSPASPTNSGELTDHTHSVLHPEDSTHFSNEGEEIRKPIDFGDRERTKARYEKAANKLKKSLSHCGENWGLFDIPEFNDIADNALLQIEETVENMLTAREKSMKNSEFWSKKKHAIQRIFTMVSPFAKNLLQIAKQGSSVLSPSNHYSIAHL